MLRLWPMPPVWSHLSLMESTWTAAAPRGTLTTFMTPFYFYYYSLSSAFWFRIMFLLWIYNKRPKNRLFMFSSSVFWILIRFKYLLKPRNTLGSLSECFYFRVVCFPVFVIVVVVVFSDGRCPPATVRASSTSPSLWRTWSDWSGIKWTIQTTRRPSKLGIEKKMNETSLL